MKSDLVRPQAVRPHVLRYWPAGASVALTVTGVITMLLRSESLLFFVGVLLLGSGIYGFSRRRPARVRSNADRPVGSPRRDLPSASKN